jgi:hypothetical protein
LITQRLLSATQLVTSLLIAGVGAAVVRNHTPLGVESSPLPAAWKAAGIVCPIRRIQAAGSTRALAEPSTATPQII